MTIGMRTSSRTSARMRSPSTPRPWNAYGDVRGLNAPPRSRVAPACLASQADSSVCSGVSTAHGPAMKVNVSGPIGTPPTRIVVRRAWFCADTSLYGAVIRIVSTTPGSPSASRVSSTSSVPTTPMIVRITPAADERLPAVGLDVRDDGVDVGVGCVRRHHDDHGRSLSTLRACLQGGDVRGLVGVGALDHHRHVAG